MRCVSHIQSCGPLRTLPHATMDRRLSTVTRFARARARTQASKRTAAPDGAWTANMYVYVRVQQRRSGHPGVGIGAAAVYRGCGRGARARQPSVCAR
jgi:hypothetical protein